MIYTSVGGPEVPAAIASRLLTFMIHKPVGRYNV
jgi:hypothetical protein